MEYTTKAARRPPITTTIIAAFPTSSFLMASPPRGVMEPYPVGMPTANSIAATTQPRLGILTENGL